MNNNNSKNLSSHISLKSLNRTPSGNIYHHDLKNIFAVLLFCLDLKNDVKKSSSILKFNFKKTFSYTFTVEKAIQVMANLSINLNYNMTSTVLSYEINEIFAFDLLQIFYSAKLLHCPEDKTCKKITSKKMTLQPSPKGVAILYQFCLKRGISNLQDVKIPEILFSNFNSMQLMEFERHIRTDNIIYNEHSDKLLFARLMGPSMNIWSSKNGPDQIPNLSSTLSLKPKFNNQQVFGADKSNESNDIQNNTLTDSAAFLEYLRKRQNDVASEENLNVSDGDESNNSPSISVTNNFNDVSPFYHRFFTNPDSDSHIQYYVSNKGVRFFKQKIVSIKGNEVIVNNCFSGKALVQCIFDCTDLMYYKDALKIANNFFKWGLIENKSYNFESDKQFMPNRDALYVLTGAGNQAVKWFVNANISPASCTSKNASFDSPSSASMSINKNKLTLAAILADPGLKYLLRTFMIENMCVENLNLFDEIIEFQKKVKILKKMVSLKDKEKSKYLEEIKNDKVFEITIQQQKSNALNYKRLTIYTAMNKLTEYCLSKLYTIFAMYLSEDAPNEVNIDSKLRFQVQNYIQSEGIFNGSDINISDIRMKMNIQNDRTIEPLELEESEASIKEDDDVKVEDRNGALVVDKQIDTNEDDKSSEKSISTQIEDKKFNKPVKSHKNLGLKLKHLRDVDVPEVSPTDIFFGPKLKFLDDMGVYYEEIKRKVYRMMERDSYGKFLESDLFKENYSSWL